MEQTVVIGKWTARMKNEDGHAYIVVSWDGGEAFFYTTGDIGIKGKGKVMINA
jgi:hypothetical protein